MIQAKTKHIIVISGKSYPAGTIVEVISKNDKLVLSKFPNMKDNINSTQIAIKFPDRETISIGLKKSFIFI